MCVKIILNKYILNFIDLNVIYYVVDLIVENRY